MIIDRRVIRRASPAHRNTVPPDPYPTPRPDPGPLRPYPQNRSLYPDHPQTQNPNRTLSYRAPDRPNCSDGSVSPTRPSVRSERDDEGTDMAGTRTDRAAGGA